MLAIINIHSGIPEEHCPFWKVKSPGGQYALYQTLTGSPAKILAMMDEPLFLNAAQEVVFGYLRQFVGNLFVERARAFLRFVTGSSVCSVETLQIEFNTLCGLGRHPIAHTCNNILELSSTYESYPVFCKEFHLGLSSDTFTWIMDASQFDSVQCYLCCTIRVCSIPRSFC